MAGSAALAVSVTSPANDQQAIRQRDINAGIITLALRDLAGVWPQIDWAHPDAAPAVKQLYGAVIQRYGQSAASVASLMYEEIRDSADLSRPYISVVADPVPQAQIDRIVDSAFLGNPTSSAPQAPERGTSTAASPRGASAVNNAQPAAAAGDELEQTHPDEDLTTSDLPLEQRVPTRLEGTATRLVQQPGRDTIAENVERDPVKPRWIRVPTGPDPCAFCVMMASRDLNETFTGYSSSKAAGIDGSSVFNSYHNHCMCVAVPVFPGQDFVDLSPNQPQYLDMYYKAAANAGTHSDPKKILAAMRQLYGLK